MNASSCTTAEGLVKSTHSNFEHPAKELGEMYVMVDGSTIFVRVVGHRCGEGDAGQRHVRGEDSIAEVLDGGGNRDRDEAAAEK
jgi:hypothetical protein